VGGSYPQGSVTGARNLWYLLREFVQLIAAQTPALWDCDSDCCSRSGVVLKVVYSTSVMLHRANQNSACFIKHHAWTCFVALEVMMIDDVCV